MVLVGDPRLGACLLLRFRGSQSRPRTDPFTDSVCVEPRRIDAGGVTEEEIEQLLPVVVRDSGGRSEADRAGDAGSSRERPMLVASSSSSKVYTGLVDLWQSSHTCRVRYTE